MNKPAFPLPVYMDYQATTPLDPAVLEAMMPFFGQKFGNPHSVNHRYGWEAEAAVDVARDHIAGLIGTIAESIIFTSGATESNNTAIKGIAGTHSATKNHLVTMATEHKCILESCHAIERKGGKVTYLPVDRGGLIDLNRLQDAITDQTALVSVMAVNNEIGVIQPLAEIGKICRQKDVLFHTDAAQAVGKIPLDVEAMNIDLMSISGHKIYGPKGIGALYIRQHNRHHNHHHNRGGRKIRLTPLMDGGGQEGGLRSGTLSPALCVGVGKACEIASKAMMTELEELKMLSTRFLEGIERQLNGVVLNGDRDHRFPGNINLSFEGVDGDLLIAELRNLAVSSGAACASASKETSYVLKEIDVPDALAKASIRFGIGRFTTVEEIDFAVEEIIEKVRKIRGL